MTVNKSGDNVGVGSPRIAPPSWSWKIAVGALGVKVAQWLVLFLSDVSGPWAGLPQVDLLPHMVAGCWVASSLVWLLMRKWIGAISAFAYSSLSLVVAGVGLASAQLIAWNVLTALSSLAILVWTAMAVVRGDFRHSRW